MNSKIKNLAIAAKRSAIQMAQASSEQKNKVLENLAVLLQKNKAMVLQANREDLTHAKNKGLSEPLRERLSLENRLEGMIAEIRQIIALSDPIGEILEKRTLPNQLKIERLRIPIGVLGVIYESRPNVTIDISALSIKSGNCVILRGGSEALNTNRALFEILQQALFETGLPREAVQLVTNTDRSEVKELLQLHDWVDLIIPRGNKTLQQFCREESTIPIVTGGIGICHLFVDETANFEQSLQVILNAKTQRPAACNALDTLLVHSAIAQAFVPQVIAHLGKEKVAFRLDPAAGEFVGSDSWQFAEEHDWDTEWLSLILGIKVVKNIDEAVEHIRRHGGHSDGILTENPQNAERFVHAVDSVAVYVNASTRFTDGGQLGMGAEVAVSTQKVHARGPMGLKELTSSKWIIRGNYQIRT